MKAAAVKTNKKDESRAAANAIRQQKKDQKGAVELAENQYGPAAARLKSDPKGQADSSTIIRISPPTPVSSVSQLKNQKNNGQGETSFVDNRPEAKDDRRLQMVTTNRPHGQNRPTTQGKKTPGIRREVYTKPRTKAQTPLQMLVLNIDQNSIEKALAKPDGWIIASDIWAAYNKEKGYHPIYDWNKIPKTFKLKSNENIHLTGHGDPGALGAKSPKAVGGVINGLIEALKPEVYKGTIKASNCYAGVGEANREPGIKALQKILNNRVAVEGPKGMALTHPVYGGRTLVINRGKETVANKILDETAKGINEEWTTWIQKNPTKGDFTKPAIEATRISEDFYIKIEKKLHAEGCLLKRDEALYEFTPPKGEEKKEDEEDGTP